MAKNLKTGLLGIGLETYWGQFEGLLEKLLSIQSGISERLTRLGSEVIDAGMVDSPSKAIAAAELFNRQGIELLILNISTYALSHNVLPLLQRTSAPILVLNLQPVKSLDFERFNSIGDRGKMTGEWLSLCQSCVTPELAGVFSRTGIRYHLVTGYLDEDYVWKEIGEWIEACRVKLILHDNRVGVIGHYYNGMLDVYSDITMLASAFGSHFELMEFGGLKKHYDSVSETDVNDKIREFRSWFEVSPECSGDDLIDAAKGSVALDRIVALNNLSSIAFYYEGEGDTGYEKIVTTLIPGMTLLTGRNIPVAGECEIKNVLAMKIMDAFGCGGSFSEFYLVDYEKDEILLGHDGPAHYKIAEGKPGLIPLPVFHGKAGKGLSIQMKVADGPVTLLSVCQGADGKITLLLAEGESVPGATMQIANTNSRYRFPIGAREFINRWSMAGPSHHCAIGVGHISEKISKLADLLNVDFLRIC
jgi:L-arabinose isomerase